MDELVLIVGSSGVWGEAFARRLSSRYGVLGLDARPPERVAPMREFIFVDPRLEESVLTALRHIWSDYGRRLLCCVFLADGLKGDEAATLLRVLLRGLDPFELDQLILAGDVKSPPLEAELLLRDLHGGLPVVLLRLDETQPDEMAEVVAGLVERRERLPPVLELLLGAASMMALSAARLGGQMRQRPSR